MFMVVEIKNNKIVWHDQKVAESQEIAQGRIDIFKKQIKHRQFQIIKLTNYKLVS